MTVLRFLVSRWVLSFVGVAILAALVWLFGPLLQPLEGWIPRAAIIAGLVLIWAVVNLTLDLLRRRREQDLEKGVAESAEVADDGTREEALALGERMTQALSLLKKARGTHGYLYEQPWYVIIGPPGAGKTTALLNSGLNFPLAAEMGQGAVAGVGGTRMCDWWFTENAVLIDTAGRYTTQDSNLAVDRAGWDAFLDLLKKTRPRQPLNGVIVAIALTDVAAASPEERTAHARAIRRRIKELQERLAIRIPVYALFTKADLISGFTEYFDDLDRDKRNQVWGVTFPLAKGEPGVVTKFPEELQLLVDRLDSQRLYDRLQFEQSPERRTLIAAFPTQIASLSQPLQAFLMEAFAGSRLDPAPFLRGVYFTSGTQEGTPIDRLTGTMARSFGLDQRRAAALRPQQGRSYFLGRLISEVILGEAMLVSEPPSARFRRMILRGAAFAVIGLVTLGLGGWLVVNRTEGEREIAAMTQAISTYRELAQQTTFDPVNDADLPRLLPLLDAARELTTAAKARPGVLASFDLSQGPKLRAGAEAVYRHALGYALLPRLVWRLEGQMRGFFTEPDFLYEATRVYLMLGGQGPLDPALIKEWMTYDWQHQYSGAANLVIVASLQKHLDALLAQPLPAVPLDDALIAQARTTFSRVSLAARAYSRIKPSAAAQALPPWKPSDVLGPAGVRVFTRASGKKLSDGIPGFFTVEGFHRVLLPALTTATREVASESWVMGQKVPANLDPTQQAELANNVIKYYLDDYAKAWDALLQDLEIVALRSLPQAAQDLYVLASPQSPMKSLLTAVARQVTLTEPPKPTAAEIAAEEAEKAAKTKAATASPLTMTRTAAALAAQLTGQQGAGAMPLGHEIDERYRQLRELVSTTGGAPIDQLLKLLNDLQQQLAKLAAIGTGSVPAPVGSDPSLALRAEAQRQPAPVDRWLSNMAESSTALRGGGARQQVAAAYNGAGGPAALCPLAVNGRFPFVPGSSLETPLDDFAKLFAPGGLLDGFFNTQLRPYIDTTGKVWKPQSADGVAAPISPADVLQFQRAAVIRDLFFAPGSTTIAVRFDITPISLTPGASSVSLELDGTSITYAHGPTRSTQITWPGANGMRNVRLVFNPPPPGGTGVFSETGPWAMFRLFSRGTLRPAGSPETFTLTFGGGDAVFELRAGSVMNPFAPGVLQDFRCPAVRG
ncbi:MAG: type VI secretion system membrane subunit TssM [Reyranella sp.]|uniref:type VI secretion system membrane subunit TssM n=1 Tax=Reyranella sp. TaxID=1929291 RepID=UPI003D11A633